MKRAAVRAFLRAAATRAAEAALSAVEPRACVREALTSRTLGGPVRVLALGKAARAMVEGAREVLGSRLRGGVAVVPAGPARPTDLGPVALVAGGHPLPDESSAAAGRRLLAEAAALKPDETALVLLSGGASSLAAVPLEGHSPAELAAITDGLLRSGAPISEINAVRSRLSRLHAGGLSAAIGGRPALTLAISDVPGERERDIGSAPMHEDAPAGERSFLVVASGRTAASAAAARLAEEGLRVALDGSLLGLDAESSAAAALQALRASGSGARGLALWGEPGVRVEMPGRGGRCTHAALAAAIALDEAPPTQSELVLLAWASDGLDGASASSGALIDGGTVGRARAGGRSPAADLESRNSALSLEAAGDLRPACPTGTNVADLWLLLRADCDDRLVTLEEGPGLRLAVATRGPRAAVLVRGELRRAVLAAAARAPGLVVTAGWEPADPPLADGWGLELEPPTASAIEALASQGLAANPGRPGLWRLGAGAPARPSWD